MNIFADQVLYDFLWTDFKITESKYYEEVVLHLCSNALHQ